ncbi:hypothetical protein DV515_00008865 [Chloebia gouldiae]|uniref:Uncharacterized protein n=1 Tax=Chloebia gouldiae TaxID=44316 RepID=A0A3L8SDE9_CHLGU|nr:hypothetical protein DV515_00008865 [Chloebia gouldiae]
MNMGEVPTRTRVFWIVHFPSPPLHPDGAQQPPGAPLTLTRVGTGLATCGIHASLSRAPVPAQ